MVRQLAHDEKLADKMLKNKPPFWDDLPEKSLASAIAVAMFIRALNGDTKAAEWLRKMYGVAPKLDQPRRTRSLGLVDMRTGEKLVVVPKSQVKASYLSEL